MTKKPQKKAVKPAEEQGRLAAAKDAVVKAAKKVAQVATHAVEAVQEHVVQPVVDAMKKPKKPKKPRFVREKKEKRPEAKAPLPPRSTKANAKLMTKGMAVPPKEEKAAGQKPKA